MSTGAARLASSILIGLLTSVGICAEEAWGICLMTPPCGCMEGSIVYCAFKGLHTIPSYGKFPDMVWSELNLSQNFLTVIPSQALREVRVSRLNMQHNSISDIYSDSFGGLSDVDTLDLSYNRIENLPDHFLYPLQDLRVLKLCYNQISNITPDAFIGGQYLKELDMTGNDLKSVPGLAFRMLSSLQRLSLRGNKLLHIEAYSFYKLPLAVLDIGENGGALDIHRGAFCGLDPQVQSVEPGVTDWTGLNELILDHNGLSDIDPCVTTMLWTLNEVDLAGNPLHCSCSLLSVLLSRTSIKFPRAQCATPKEQEGHYLDQINASTMKCAGMTRPKDCRSLCTSPPPLLKLTYVHVSGVGARQSSWHLVIVTLILYMAR